METNEKVGGKGRFSWLHRGLSFPVRIGRELKTLLLFLLLNLISSISYYIFEVFFGTTEKPTIWFLVVAICVSCTLACIEMLGAYVLRRIPKVRAAYVVLIAAMYNVFIVVDYFCLYKFHVCFLHDFFDAVWQTSLSEAMQFMRTYLTVGAAVALLVGVALFNLIVVLLSKLIARVRNIAYFIAVFGVLGLACWGYMAVWFVLYRSSTRFHLCSAPTRIVYFYGKAVYQKRGISILSSACEQVNDVEAFADAPNVVVVIGESASVYHSQIYGYHLATTPTIQRLQEQGELIAFDNAVSVADYTYRVMKSVYSLDSMGTDFFNTPLFPAVYKGCKWKTALYDNSYYAGKGNTFLADVRLSKILFDIRNEHGYDYDGDLVNTVQVQPKESLCVIHLFGQHYLYGERYPESWKFFTLDQYDKQRWNAKQRKVIAEYDNAMRYNDYVLGQIIDKFQHTNSVVIYFSDHGEEVFELRDLNGHGTAALSQDLRYQIRVPMFIWMSAEYREKHSDIYQRALANKHTPIITDDVSHTILGLGGVQSEWYRPTRDFLNPEYFGKKQRIVLNSIDYDERVRAYEAL